MPALHDLGVGGAAKAISAGEITAEQLAEALLARASANANLGAFITLDPDRVRAAARKADQARTSGASLGPLHGVPLALKDNLDTAELPTSGGTPGLAGNRPKRNAAIVDKLLGAGAIVLGKTNLHELAYGITNNNAAHGPARNPYAPDRIPGASSGGTGVAVAARIAPGGIGTDTGGSVRIPAALCGIVGLRPTTGRWSQAGVVPISHTRDTPGPMTRSVADCALLDGVVTGGPVEAAPVQLKGVRIGVPRKHFWENLDPELEKICEGALRRLTDAGVILVDVDMSEEASLDAEAGFPIALYETVTDLNIYLAEHGVGFDFATLAAKTASPDVKGILQSLTGAGAVPEAAYRKALAATVRPSGHLQPSFSRSRNCRHLLPDHARSCGENRRRRDVYAQWPGASDLRHLYSQYRPRQRRRHSRNQSACRYNGGRLADRHGAIRTGWKRSKASQYCRGNRAAVAEAAGAAGASLTLK